MNEAILRGGYAGLFRSGADIEGLLNAVGEPAGLQPAMKNDTLVLHLYDAIDSYVGVGPADFVDALDGQADTPVWLYINSPGGDVFEGRTIANILRRHPGGVEARIDGLCASAATTVAMGAGVVKAAPGARFMIHRTWTLALGDCAALRSAADLCEGLDGELAEEYARRTGLAASEVMAMMDKETWLTAQEAVEKRFVDGLLEAEAPRAESPDPERVRNTRRFAAAVARLASLDKAAKDNGAT